MEKKIKIAHIINPIDAVPTHPSYLHYAQPITFESLRNAKEYVDKLDIDELEVELFTAQYEEDRGVIPDYLTKTPDLEKSCLDYFHFKQEQRKLPLIRDILYKLYDNTDADYLVYSNVDISVKPNFYKYIYDRIKEGYDGLTICRWDINKGDARGRYTVDSMERLYKAKGQVMPGFDCFVMHRDILPKLYLGYVFIGYPPIGKVLWFGIRNKAKKSKYVASKNDLTFHLGVDKPWGNRNSEYYKANMREESMRINRGPGRGDG